MRQTFFVFLLSGFLLLGNSSQAQNTRKDTLFAPPLNIPLFLSGTFAELRSNHFHGGIDLKTQGKTGFPVTAPADGYVSRIKIQSDAYGKALYVTHANGYTTVYAHLNRFTPEINKYVKNYQYNNQTHEVNLFPPQDKFVFKQGELMAYSGNTGRSGGPHLHFEIRRTAGQIPQNGLLYNFPIADNIRPKVYHVAIYPKTSGSHVDYSYKKKVIPTHGLYDTIVIQDTIPVSGLIGLGVETYDYSDNSANPCGVYSIGLEVNNELIYKSELNAVGFGETRYINSLVDYEEKHLNDIKLQKLFLDPHNQLSIYKHMINDGLIEINDTAIYHARIKIADTYGNQSVVKCWLKGAPSDSIFRTKDSNVVKTFYPHEINHYHAPGFSISLPEKTLYDSIYFTYQQIPDHQNTWSDIHQVHKPTTPAHKYFTIGLKPKNEIPKKLRPHAVIYRMEEEDTSTVDTRWENEMLMGRTRNFGMYTIAIDTVPPQIIPVDFIPGENLQSNKRIRFTIEDNLGDITSYNGYINGEWVLFEYDAKNDLLFFEIDSEKINNNEHHDLELYVSDEMNNMATYHATFYY